MRSRVLTGARLHVSQIAQHRPAMLTLTYRSPTKERPNAWHPRHISHVLTRIREWCDRRGVAFRYVWVAEIQEARRLKEPHFHCVHYHVLIWLPPCFTLPKPDKRGWWPHGMTKIETARHAVGYAAKYVTKGEDSASLPKGARICGVGGLRGKSLAEARWWALPTWLRGHSDNPKIPMSDGFQRKPGGLWVSRSTGEIFTSPWEADYKHGTIWLRRKPDTGDPPTVPAAGEA